MDAVRKSKLSGTVIAPAVILMLLYVLSTGPVYWLFDYFGWPTSILIAVYWPLLQLGEICGPFADVMIWYLRHWVDIAGA